MNDGIRVIIVRVNGNAIPCYTCDYCTHRTCYPSIIGTASTLMAKLCFS